MSHAAQIDAALPEIRLLGPVAALRDDETLPISGLRRRALLALLALRPDRVVSSGELLDGIWGAQPPAHARHALHVYVSALRRELGGATIGTERGGYRLRLPPRQIDASCFTELVAEAERLEPAAASATLRRALALWHGPALAGLDGGDALTGAAAELEERRLVALERCVDVELALGRHAELAGELSAIVAAEPGRERFRAQLMLCLYRCGRQSEALDAYRDGRRLLVEEFGIEPREELRRLEQAILRQDPDLDLDPRQSAPAGLVELPVESTVEEAAIVADSWRLSLRYREERAFAAVDAERERLDWALHAAVARGLRAPALRLVRSLWFYWIVRGRAAEMLPACRAALQLTGRAPAQLEADGLIGVSELAKECDAAAESVRLKLEALSILRGLGREVEVAALLADLAELSLELGDDEAAYRYAGEALELRTALGESGGIQHALQAVAAVAWHRGDLEQAIAHLEDVVARLEELGLDEEAADLGARALGRARREAGDVEGAFAAYRRALNTAVRARSPAAAAAAVHGLGWVAARRGDQVAAARHYGSISEEPWQGALKSAERRRFRQDVEEVERSLDPGVFATAWAAGLRAPPFVL